MTVVLIRVVGMFDRDNNNKNNNNSLSESIAIPTKADIAPIASRSCSRQIYGSDGRLVGQSKLPDSCCVIWVSASASSSSWSLLARPSQSAVCCGQTSVGLVATVRNWQILQPHNADSCLADSLLTPETKLTVCGNNNAALVCRQAS